MPLQPFAQHTDANYPSNQVFEAGEVYPGDVLAYQGNKLNLVVMELQPGETPETVPADLLGYKITQLYYPPARKVPTHGKTVKDVFDFENDQRTSRLDVRYRDPETNEVKWRIYSYTPHRNS